MLSSCFAKYFILFPDENTYVLHNIQCACITIKKYQVYLPGKVTIYSNGALVNVN